MYVVKVLPSLSLAITAAGVEFDCDVTAKVDTTSATVFLTEQPALPRVDGGGRALAALFLGDERLVAQAWRAAYDQAEEGITAQPLRFASELAERESAELEARLADFGEEIARKHPSPRGSAGEKATKTHQSRAAIDQHQERVQPSPAAAPRTLVDPQSLMLVDPKGNIEKGPSESGISKSAPSDRVLNEPKGISRRPQNRSPLRSYSDLDKENAGFELLQVLLGSDHEEIVDLRTQRGVGADAIDQLKNFYELKVSAGSEPDQVTLTNSEVQRALSTPDFFLVVVSNIEESADARPTIRVVPDPLQQLHSTDRGTITLSGVREATSRVYSFAPIEGEQTMINE